MKRSILTTTLALALSAQAQAQLLINELMQSNIDCVMDDMNEFPDSWVELYNGGTGAVNLNQYKLGITDKAAEAWQLPTQMVGPQQRVLIYCDKESTGLHAPFRLESGKGCEVYLFSGTAVADKVTGLKKQPAPNVAYGRQTDGSSTWGYMLTPTPAAANCGQVSSQILGDPVFSVQGKVVTSNQAFELAITPPAGTPQGAEIRITTNGSEPTRTSTLYVKPISISGNRIVRAKLFCDGWISPRSVTQSYIFFPRELTLPVVSIVTDNKYLTDSKIGIYVDGNYQSGKKNYEFNWRRPLNVEMFFDGVGTPSNINQLGEMRIQGGATRNNKFKSLALYAHKRFGTKRFNYEFFPDQRPGLDDYKSVVLRNSGNDFDYLYMRDAVIQRSMAERVDLDWQAWRPAIIFINGIYKGMLNIRERANEDNIYTNYDGLEDIDMIENWWDLKEGDWDHWNRFQAFYNEHGHTMAEYEQWMDCHEFINLMLMNLYYNNQDFPGNNIVMWRPRTADGRWRFIAKDTDFGLGLYRSSATYNTIEWIYNPNYDYNRNWANGYEHTRLFRRLMEDKDFNREFIDRAAIYMGDFMNAEGTHEVWDPMYEQIKTEYPNHRKLINEWWPNYQDEMNFISSWLNQRTGEFYKQIGNYYKLGTPLGLTINPGMTAEELQGTEITFNGVKLTKGKFNGKFYPNRAVTLKSNPVDGKVVTEWIVTHVNGSQTTAQTIMGDTYSFAMPAVGSVVINAKFGSASGIDAAGADAADFAWHADGNQLSISRLSEGTWVRLYDMRGMLLHEAQAQGSEMQLSIKSGQMYILKVGAKSLKIRN